MPALLFLLCLNMQAQKSAQYLYLNVGGGSHNLTYDISDGTRKGALGYTANAGYSYFFSPHWGWQTGLGLRSVSAKSVLNYMSGTPSVDTDDDSYEFRTYYTNWTEKQQLLLLDIPIGLQFKHALGRKMNVLATAGGKIDIPVCSDYKVESGQIETKGYYSQWNAEVSNNARHGFTTFTDRVSGDLLLKTTYSVYADLGGLYPVSDKLNLYMGGYINYGLTHLSNGGSKMVYQQDGVYNGLFASNLIDHVKAVSFGVKVGLYFCLGHKKSTESKVSQVLDITLLVPKKEPVEVVDTPVVVEPQVVVPVKDSTTNDSIDLKEDPYTRAKAIVATLRIRFKLNSVKPFGFDYDRIKELSEILKANPDMNLLITGHTCNLGSRKVNLRFGMKRAIAVKRIFLRKGASSSQLLIESKAYDEPLVPNINAANRAKNRRVQLILE